MSDYWFFLSYSHTDDDIYLKQFVSDLTKRIRRFAGLKAHVAAEDIGFFDRRGLEVGDTWDNNLADALQNSRVLLCLHSRSYFNSEWCGKEFQVFRWRVEDFVKSSPEKISPPPLIIPVLWDPPHRFSRFIPESLAALKIQPTDLDLGEVYAQKGLRALVALRQSRYEAEYFEFMESIAGKIVDNAEQTHLKSLKTLPPLKEIKSAFVNAAVASEAPEITSATSIQNNTGPGIAQFFYVAGSSSELEAVRPGASCYGSVGGFDWRPWDPPNKQAIAVLAQKVVSDQGIVIEHLPIDDKLVDRIRKAEDTNTMVVMVVDPWSIKIPTYRDMMSEYDRYLFSNCAVLIMWDEEEQGSGSGPETLFGDIRTTFNRTRSNTNYFRYPIASVDEFEREVSSAIYEIRRRLMQNYESSEVDRPVPGGTSLPTIDSPGGAS